MLRVQRFMEGLQSGSLKETHSGNGGKTVPCYGSAVTVRLSCPFYIYGP